MPDTAQLQPLVPAGSCRGSCNLRAARALLAHHEALVEHADAVDRWYAAGGSEQEFPPEPEAPRVRFWPGNPLFCGRCVANARRTLLDLDVLASQLAAAADGHRGRAASSAGEGRVSGTKVRPSVSPVTDVLDRLVGDLFDVEDEWRGLRGYPARQSNGGRGAHPRSRTIGWLAERLEDILGHEDMAGLPRKLSNWDRVLRHLAKDDRASTSSPVRCVCGERRVGWDQELGYYVCGGCGTLLSVDEHDRQVREEADAMEAAGAGRRA
ncbi:hypothetical protein [Microbispora rosea]|uniref:hypothetical protein n=1 Tax=Microbispora rosea TaxID=58117 RepID=UPI00378E2152